ncbi:hypothetical protein HDU77_004874 [Chytriomyces hyalinus]|nr:hypothetical protein HDU77_004874 [Chytriomyces hyalinus]
MAGGKGTRGRGGRIQKRSRATKAKDEEMPGAVIQPVISIGANMTCRDAIMLAEFVADYCVVLTTFTAPVFMAELLNLAEKKIDLSPAAKARIMAAFWLNRKVEEFDHLMFVAPGFFGVSELFKLVPVLDKPRQMRQLEARISRLKDKVKASKLKNMIRELQDLQKEPHTGNLTSSFSRRVSKYVSTISDEVLTFQALNYPTDNWRQVADLCHLRPTDFSLPWFLPFCFGAPAPEGTLVHAMTTMTTETLPGLLTTFPYLAECYSMIRQRVQESKLKLTEEAQLLLTQKAPVEDVIWFYEDIVGRSIGAESALFERLKNGEFTGNSKSRINYPKLMERILLLEKYNSKSVRYLMEFATGMLDSISLPENNLKVAVFGDCSGSMSVAVNTATILASVFTARLNAKLTFFNNICNLPPVQPETTDHVLAVAKAMRAYNGTSPAACLFPYLRDQIPVDLFIVVTDEEENMHCNGQMFAPMFKSYLEKVNPQAKLFFISFLAVGVEGDMVSDLKKIGIVAKQFRFDATRPDLSKFDELLGLLALQILDGNGKAGAAAAAADGMDVIAAETIVASVVDSSVVAVSAELVDLNINKGEAKDDDGWEVEEWV